VTITKYFVERKGKGTGKGNKKGKEKGKGKGNGALNRNWKLSLNGN